MPCDPSEIYLRLHINPDDGRNATREFGSAHWVSKLKARASREQSAGPRPFIPDPGKFRV
jgi:hypothetical protein